MIEVKYQVESTAPLLMHNVQSMALKKPTGISHEDWEAADECFQAKMYRDGNDVVIQPDAWMSFLKEAAKKSGIKQDRKRSGYAPIMGALIYFNGNTPIAKVASVERHSAFVNINKSKVLRIRPMLRNWKGVLSLTIADEKQLPLPVLDEFMAYGGTFCGIGNYRPQFGRFVAKRLKK